MKLAIYCSPNLDNWMWLENQVLEFLYLTEESISFLQEIKEVAIICANDNVVAHVGKTMTARPKIQLSYKYDKNASFILVLRNHNDFDALPNEFLADQINMNIRYYEENTEYENFK